MKPRILVISGASMDFIQRSESFPAPGDAVAGISYEYIPGGAGACTSLSLLAMGADCIYCARVGADSNGQRLRAIYREAGIDTRFIFMERKAPTGLSSVMSVSGEPSRYIKFSGANALLSAVDIEEAFTSLPDAVLLHLSVPERAALAATEFAVKKNIPVIINTGGVRADYQLTKLFPCEIFATNETELAAFTGIAPTNTENCLRAVIRLASMVKSKYYIIKMGERGAFLYDGKYYNIVLAYDVNAVDKTAAGDIFTAALSSEYMKTKDIMHAVRYANAAAAISITREGALNSIPTDEEIAEFAAKRQIKL